MVKCWLEKEFLVYCSPVPNPDVREVTVLLGLRQNWMFFYALYCTYIAKELCDLNLSSMLLVIYSRMHHGRLERPRKKSYQSFFQG